MGAVEECREYLMEADWQEGFTCSLPVGHLGRHRAEGGVNEVNVSTDVEGRSYRWVYEWYYPEGVVSGLQAGPQRGKQPHLQAGHRGR